MRTRQLATVLMCVACLAALGSAQTPAPAAPDKSVLNHVPAGSLGFAVVNNVKELTDAVDKFLVEIGVDKMVKDEMPDGLLAMIQGGAKLGKGFNPNAGFAAVMLDPKKFDIDMMKLLGMSPPEEGQEGKPAEKPRAPFVLFVPGKSIASVFDQQNLDKTGKYTKIRMPGADPVATKLGDFILISPMPEALDAVTKSTKSVMAELTRAEKKIILGSGAAIYVNMKVAGPILTDVMKTFSPVMGVAGPSSPEQAMMKATLGVYEKLFTQMRGITLAARFEKTGVVVDLLMSFKGDSVYADYFGKIPQRTALLAKLPDLKYVLAFGVAETKEASRKKAQEDMGTNAMTDAMLKALLKDVPAETHTKIVNIFTGFVEQVGAVQFVAGGPADNVGMFGVDMVISCKDADKFKALLAEAATTAETVIKAVAGEDDKDMAGLKIAYQKGVETIGAVSVDAITISHPELAKLDEDERAEMTKILGEDKIRILVAAADKKTVVITFGGAKAMMAKALATAQAGNGTILKSKDAAEALKHMPANCGEVILFNAGNLMELILAGMKKMDPDEDPALPFKITCKVPIAIGVAVVGGDMHLAVYAPNKLIKEFVGIIGAFTLKEKPVPPGKAPGGDDF